MTVKIHKIFVDKIFRFDPLYGILYSLDDSKEERRVTYDTVRECFIDCDKEEKIVLEKLEKFLEPYISSRKEKGEIKVGMNIEDVMDIEEAVTRLRQMAEKIQKGKLQPISRATNRKISRKRKTETKTEEKLKFEVK